MNSEMDGKNYVASAAKDIGALLLGGVGWLLPGVTAMLLVRTGIMGSIFPFGTAFVASMGSGSVVSAVLGAAVGCLLPGMTGDPLRLAAAAVAAAGIRWALSELRRVADSPLFPALTALVASVLTGLAVTTASGAMLGYELLLFAGEGLMAAAAAYFFTGAQRTVEAAGGLRGLLAAVRAIDRQGVCSILVSAVILAVPVCRLTVGGFSPGLVAVMALALMAAYYCRETGGAIGGIAVGIVAALAQGSPEKLGICAAAGLVAALFMPLGAIAGAAVFGAVCIVGTVAVGTIDPFLIGEAVCAALLFALLTRGRGAALLGRLLPAGVAVERTPRLRFGAEGKTPRRRENEAAELLRQAAEGLCGVSQTVCQVSERLDMLDGQNESVVFRKAAQTVCGSCALSAHCWNGGRERTNALLSLLEKPLRTDGSLTRLNVPVSFREGCARWVELSEEVNRRWALHIAREGARRRVAQVRSVVSEQLGGVGELLEGLSERLESHTAADDIAELVTEELRQWGCRLQGIECLSEGENRLELRLSIASWEDGELKPHEIADVLGELLELQLEAEEEQPGSITLRSRPRWSVSFGAAQHICGGEALCGDSYSAADMGDRAVLLLSDGMGSGGRAAVDAAMTCGLLERLLKVGFAPRGALRVVNSALLVRAEDESLATADCVSVDLYTGKARFCKAGAVCSFLRRGDEIIHIDMQSLPLGILREVDCAEQELQLEEGDVVVLVSDGAGDSEQCSWLRSELLAYDGTEPRLLARNIIAAAEAKRCGEDDDMTSLVFQVSAKSA